MSERRNVYSIIQKASYTTFYKMVHVFFQDDDLSYM